MSQRKQHVSGDLGTYTVFTFETPTGVNCPIDGTELLIPEVSYANRGPQSYECRACNKTYYGIHDPATLKEEAKIHVRMLQERTKELEREVKDLTAIIDAAKKRGIQTEPQTIDEK